VRPSGQPLLRPLFIAVGDFLADGFPDLLQLLQQKHAFSLDFLGEDCACWFASCFGAADVRRLWVSILAFSSFVDFFQCFIISLLYSLTPRIVEMNPMNTDDFVRKFHELKKNVSLTLLLKNTVEVKEFLRGGRRTK
jgi:hypothetical protein